ncbi:MAG: BLUF domain-containing protein [Caulobacteraceae bacterium]|nr:BLUF domain-containing protein [Caulobacteraceae bacterium]
MVKLKGEFVLFCAIVASELVGSAGASTLSVAQILGVSERNNRRDDVTSGILFHDGWCLHAMEGSRSDLDRLLRRLREDPRIRTLRIVVDQPIARRRFCRPISLCENPAALLKTIGSPDLGRITAFEAERIVEFKKAA